MMAPIPATISPNCMRGSPAIGSHTLPPKLLPVWPVQEGYLRRRARQLPDNGILELGPPHRKALLPGGLHRPPEVPVPGDKDHLFVEPPAAARRRSTAKATSTPFSPLWSKCP
jgi:hypothetical protein